jgi:hypothetical protein
LSETIHERVSDAGQVLVGIFLRKILGDLGSHIADPKTKHLALIHYEGSQEIQRVAALDENFAACAANLELAALDEAVNTEVIRPTNVSADSCGEQASRSVIAGCSSTLVMSSIASLSCYLHS